MFVIDVKYDVLAENAMAAALLGDFARFPPAERNLVWQLFCGNDSGGPGIYPEHEVEEFAQQCVADLRAATARYPADPGIRDLLARLHAHSPAFVRRWNEHRVSAHRGTTKRIRHPSVGELVL